MAYTYRHRMNLGTDTNHTKQQNQNWKPGWEEMAAVIPWNLNAGGDCLVAYNAELASFALFCFVTSVQLSDGGITCSNRASLPVFSKRKQ